MTCDFETHLKPMKTCDRNSSQRVQQSAKINGTVQHNGPSSINGRSKHTHTTSSTTIVNTNRPNRTTFLSMESALNYALDLSRNPPKTGIAIIIQSLRQEASARALKRINNEPPSIHPSIHPPSGGEVQIATHSQPLRQPPSSSSSSPVILHHTASQSVCQATTFPIVFAHCPNREKKTRTQTGQLFGNDLEPLLPRLRRDCPKNRPTIGGCSLNSSCAPAVGQHSE